MRRYTTVQCTECGENNEEGTVSAGLMRLPEGWEWVALGCNWGNGTTWQPACPECQPYYQDNDPEGKHVR